MKRTRKQRLERKGKAGAQPKIVGGCVGKDYRVRLTRYLQDYVKKSKKRNESLSQSVAHLVRDGIKALLEHPEIYGSIKPDIAQYPGHGNENLAKGDPNVSVWLDASIEFIIHINKIRGDDEADNYFIKRLLTIASIAAGRDLPPSYADEEVERIKAALEAIKQEVDADSVSLVGAK